MYKRLCCLCNVEIEHPNLHAYKQAIKRGRPCWRCSKKPANAKPRSFEKACTTCGHKTFYTSQEAKVVGCKSCAMKKLHADNPDRASGKNNPMYGTSAIKKWRDTLPQEQFEAKLLSLKAKRSANSVGENNPMFGKPAPLKSGNGISGKYKGLHFRSLLELAFLERFEQINGHLPKSAESLAYMTKLENGRNYFPDFVDGDLVFEIKPSKLIGTPENALKIAAASRRFGCNFLVVTERELDNYHGIKKRLHAFSELVLNLWA